MRFTVQLQFDLLPDIILGVLQLAIYLVSQHSEIHNVINFGIEILGNLLESCNDTDVTRREGGRFVSRPF